MSREQGARSDGATEHPIVAALFVDPTGPYVGRAGVDPWDQARNALLYDGDAPAVVHSPCERWGRFAEGAPTNKRFKVGDDGGCFEHGLRIVRHRQSLIGAHEPPTSSASC